MVGRAPYTYLCLALPECMALRAFCIDAALRLKDEMVRRAP